MSKSLIKKEQTFILIENLLFHLSLLLTFLAGPFLWGARLGWMLIGMIAMKNKKWIFYSVFFFSAFFMTSGFANDLFFTLKHFHISVMILILIQSLKVDPLKFIHSFVFIGKLFLPLLALIFITLYEYATGVLERESLFFVLNFSTTGFLALIAAVSFSEHILRQKNLEDLKVAINYFSAGVAVQIIIAIINVTFSCNFMNEANPLHNNHLGFLCNLSFFHTLTLLGLERVEKRKRINFALCFVLIIGIVVSCSRTTWICFFLMSIFFMGAVWYLNRKSPEHPFHLNKKAIIYTIVCVLILLCFFVKPIWERLYHLPQLLNPKYWEYTLNDSQNFGFLGIYRLRDMYYFQEIIKENYLFGIGFQRSVTDIHGLHYVIIAASGIVGYLSFLLFVMIYLLKLVNIAKRSACTICRYVAVACISTWGVWLLASIMETFILQFAIWTNIVISSILLWVDHQRKTIPQFWQKKK